MPKTESDIESARGRQVAALPWRLEQDGTVSVMLITSRTNAKWMLPKGWPMEGKSDAEAAQQEALEEAGVEGVVSEMPVGSYYFIMLLDDGTTKPSQAIVYPLQVTRKRVRWDEKRQRQRRWFRAHKAAKVVFEPDLARFLGNLASGRIVLAPARQAN